MDYSLPGMQDKNALTEYLQEHFANGENHVIFCQDMLLENYAEWVRQMQHNATDGNGEWGISLLLLCRNGADLTGILCIRPVLSPALEALYGNIGYGVRPSARCRGYATQMLRHALDVCREKGRKSVLLGCHSDNAASAAVIRKCGGILTKTVKESDDIINHYYKINL